MVQMTKEELNNALMGECQDEIDNLVRSFIRQTDSGALMFDEDYYMIGMVEDTMNQLKGDILDILESQVDYE